MENTVLVSVIIPIYNVQDYIEECLVSVISQTYTNLEIICVNDATKDDSMDIVHRYAQRDCRICIVNHNVNRGLSAARNSGMEIAKGDYIQFVDSDDVIAENMIELMLEKAKDENLDMVGCQIEKFGELYTSQTQTALSQTIFDRILSGRELFCEMIETNSLVVESWRFLFKSNFIRGENLIFKEGLICEDIFFTVDAYIFAKKILFLNKKLYFYRQRQGSIMYSQLSSELHVKSKFVLLIELLYRWKSIDCTERENRAFRKFYIQRFWDFKNLIEKYDSVYEKKLPYLPEETLFELLLTPQNISVYIELNADDLNILKKYPKIHLYGAGKAAGDIINILKKNNLEIIDILVTERTTKSYQGISVVSIGEMEPFDEEDIVVIATTEKYHQEIKCLLLKYGMNNILCPHNV